MSERRSVSREDVPLADLFVQLKKDVLGLVDSELALLRAEAFIRIAAGKIGVGTALASLAVGLVGLMCVAAGAVIGLGRALDGQYVLAAILVGGVLLLVSGIVYAYAHKHLRTALAVPSPMEAGVERLLGEGDR